MKETKGYFLFRNGRYWFWVFALLVVLFLICPSATFKTTYSTLLLDREGIMLGARVAKDDQWRFPVADQLPEKYVQALICYEDHYFYFHPGINPVSMMKALIRNLQQGRIISGGSTLTMQVVRLSRNDPPRNVGEKLIEMIIALKTDLVNRKATILKLYAAHAPFGGNVVGVEAASWRYFGVPPDQLSWAESATLAVLPNAPSLIFPGRNRERLLKKRNRLLEKMHREGILDQETFELAISEPVPGYPHPLPQLAPHLLNRAVKEGFGGQRIASAIDLKLQQQTNELVNRYHILFRSNEVNNAAVLLLDTRTGEVIAYTGNTAIEDEQEGGDVDMIMAKRNFGSLLKPFLYAAMLNEGLLLPDMLVSDIPVSFQGYSPNNFDKTFSGMAPAGEALARSLNVPSVILLRNYGINKFNILMKDLGMSTLTHPPEHYGLSIILGGAEGTLWEMTSLYAALGNYLGEYGVDSLSSTYFKGKKIPGSRFYCHRFSPSVVWFTLQALTNPRRPDEEGTIRYYTSLRKIAWKTGTSYGSRDAWAVGVTPAFTVGVWVGNADGEGRPGITGISCAAPLMKDVFGLLPETGWFNEPLDDMVTVKICPKSGHIASGDCPETETRRIMARNTSTRQCPYHKPVHLDLTVTWRVTDRCCSPGEMINTSWFVLPPVQEWFYRQSHPGYQPLPPFLAGCRDEMASQHPIGLIYPYPGTKIYLPRKGDQQRSPAIWKATHRDPGATLYWHLDNRYLAKTTGTHHLEVLAEPGVHVLTLVDDTGESLMVSVEMVGERGR